MSRLNDIQDEIEIIEAELKFRRTLGMATSDIPGYCDDPAWTDQYCTKC